MSVKAYWNTWDRLGHIGITLMVFPGALIGVSFVLSAIGIVRLGKPYQDAIGTGLFFFGLIVLSVASTVLLSWLLAPVWGWYYLCKIESDYGPKTRARVWEWFGKTHEQDAKLLSIPQLAAECDESQHLTHETSA